MREQTHIVVGLGEVGAALADVLSVGAGNRVVGVDPAKKCYAAGLEPGADFLHVCIPFGPSFIEAVNAYIVHLDPETVVVHSTVPVGTTRELAGGDAVHSPVEGLHPHLGESIKTFTKHFGGKNATAAAAPFADLGIKTKTHNKPETTELQKLLGTSWYGIALMVAREQAKICRQLGLSYQEVVQGYTKDYNDGYAALDHAHFTRPILHPPGDKIGGHCIAQNLPLLVKSVPGLAPIHEMLGRYNNGLPDR